MKFVEWIRDVMVVVVVTATIYVCLPAPTKPLPPGYKTKTSDIPVHRFDTLSWNLHYFLILLEEDYGGSLVKDSISEI